MRDVKDKYTPPVCTFLRPSCVQKTRLTNESEVSFPSNRRISAMLTQERGVVRVQVYHSSCLGFKPDQAYWHPDAGGWRCASHFCWSKLAGESRVRPQPSPMHTHTHTHTRTA